MVRPLACQSQDYKLPISFSVPSTEVLRYLKDFLDVNAEPDGSEFLPQHASVASQDYIIRANLEPRSTKVGTTVKYITLRCLIHRLSRVLDKHLLIVFVNFLAF